MKFVKKNGFPTTYGYACGHGKVIELDDNRKSIFECESHTQIDVKHWLDGTLHWEVFSYADYNKPKCQIQKLAENYFKSLRLA